MLLSALAKAISHTDGLSQLASSLDDEERLVFILKLLAQSGRPEDIARIDEILVNLFPLLQIPASRDVYNTILQSLVDADHGAQAREFLTRIHRSPDHPDADIDQLNIVLKGCKNGILFADALVDIQRLKLQPTNETFQLIFKAQRDIAVLEKTAPDVGDLSWLIDTCVQQGMTYDPVITGALFDTYAVLSRPQDAAKILEIYQSTCPASTEETQDSSSDKAFEPSSKVLNIGKWSKEAFVGGASVQEVSLEKCIADGRIEDALEQYEKALESGALPPTSLLTSFLRLVVDSPTPIPYLDRTVTLVRGLADAGRAQAPEDPRRETEMAVYHALIRVFTSAQDTGLYSPVINDIISDMEKRGLRTDTQLTSVTRVILEMRAKGSFEDAREVYRKNRPFLGVFGYTALLKEYCRISLAGDLDVALITEFFSIVHDMRLARVPIHASIYGIFITALGQAATRITNEGDPTGHVGQRLVDTTRRVHDFLTLDASVNPDAILWNQLMDTYQRLGCFAEAFRLWDIMYLSRRYDQVSVNIILDACGYLQDLRKARSILARLEKGGFKLDLRNWNTWIECLCRCGRMDEAAEVLLVEMDKRGVKADMQTVGVLFKFLNKGASNEQTANIRRRLEAHVPTLWRRLPKEVPNP